MIKYLVVALDEVKVKTLVLSHFLSARTKKAPIQIQNGRCYLVRLGVLQNWVLNGLLGHAHMA